MAKKTKPTEILDLTELEPDRNLIYDPSEQTKQYAEIIAKLDLIIEALGTYIKMLRGNRKK